MSQINKAVATEKTHEGAPARRIDALAQLRRAVCACLLWEDQFYESGKQIGERIRELVTECDPVDVAALAITARTDHNLRHVPLLLVRELARHPQRMSPGHKGMVRDTLPQIIQRADEIGEFMAIYWKDGKTPIAKQVKQGLARAFAKFDEYQLAKYNRDKAVKLRDVMFMVHPVPADRSDKIDVSVPAIAKAKYKRGEVMRHGGVFLRLADNQLQTPDTWEVQLSGGADKKETFERLIREEKLGYLALLRNLRNMTEAQVDPKLVEEAILARKGGAHRVLPFRFIAAARHAPMFTHALDVAMAANVQGEKLPGMTLVLVDVSGSMNAAVSAKSDLKRFDAAAGVAVVARDMCERCRVFAFSDKVKEVANFRGLALHREVIGAMPHGGTMLGHAINEASANPHDRIIVITDEQSADRVPNPKRRGYMINVASYKNGVGYGPWVHIDGFSEAVVRWIQEYEREQAPPAAKSEAPPAA